MAKTLETKMKKQFFTDKKIFKTKDDILENKKIRILSKMGLSGDFHTLHCKDEKNNFYVLKIRKEKSKITKQRFLTEIYLLKNLQPENIDTAYLSVSIECFKIPCRK